MEIGGQLELGKRLLPKIGGGRVAAVEVLIDSSADAQPGTAPASG